MYSLLLRENSRRDAKDERESEQLANHKRDLGSSEIQYSSQTHRTGQNRVLSAESTRRAITSRRRKTFFGRIRVVHWGGATVGVNATADRSQRRADGIHRHVHIAVGRHLDVICQAHQGLDSLVVQLPQRPRSRWKRGSAAPAGHRASPHRRGPPRPAAGRTHTDLDIYPFLAGGNGRCPSRRRRRRRRRGEPWLTRGGRLGWGWDCVCGGWDGGVGRGCSKQTPPCAAGTGGAARPRPRAAGGSSGP